MGRQPSAGGTIYYIPARGNRPAETVAAILTRRGESREDAIARTGTRLPRGTRRLELSAEDISAYGGRTGFGDADINDFLQNNSPGRRLVQREATGAGSRRVGAADATNLESTASQRTRRAQARIERAQENARRLENERRRVTRQISNINNSDLADSTKRRRVAPLVRQAQSLAEQVRAARSAARGG